MLLFTIISISLIVSSNCEIAFRDVNTEQGPVRGYKVDDDEVVSFFGIPYATTPRGENRHKAPLPPTTRTEIFNATVRNIGCPQNFSGLHNVSAIISTFDCLVLNVFVPDIAEINKTNIPVYVYITGGGYQTGYSNEYTFLEMVKRGMIVVTINYRLGLHGFLCLGTEFAPGNAGLKDQTEGLRWVKKNIANFGGNPDTITLGGSSSAASSVELQMLSPMANGLFTKLILESGSALSWNLFTTTPLVFAENYVNARGIYTNENVEELESYFKSLTDDDMSSSIYGVEDPKSPGFLPCIESHNLNDTEKFIDDRPINIAREGRFEQRPILTGFTLMEGLVLSLEDEYAYDAKGMPGNFSNFLPPDLMFESTEQQEEVADEVKEFYFPTGNITLAGHIEYYTDMSFAYPQYVAARYYAQSSKPVYLYLFSYNGTVNLPSVYLSPIFGPGHVAQMLYIYKSQHPISYKSMNNDDYLTQNRLRTIWHNFIVHGDPIPSRTELLDADWEPLDNCLENFLNINLTLSAGRSPFHERFALWDKVYGRGIN